MKKGIRQCFSAALGCIVLLSMAAPCMAVQAASTQPKIEYSFSGNNTSGAGYAEGTIKFTAPSSGTYRLYWADNEKALEGYSRIAKFTPSSAGETGKVSLGYHTVIPAGATKIIACQDSTKVSDAVAVYDIPSNKQLYSGSGRLLYTFSSFSDVHIDRGRNWYVNSDTNLNEALNYSVDRGSDYIVISGDVITNDLGPDKEWQYYQKLLSQSNYVNPIWESDGNHDLHQGVESGLKAFVLNTGTDSTKETFDSGKSYFYMEEKNTGDVFIFMSLELNKAPKDGDELTDEQLSWAENLVEEYTAKGANVFLLQHSPIEGYGAGDRMTKPYYGGMLNPLHSSTKKFKAMLEKHPNIIWLSGHTHEDFDMDYNYSDENGTSAHMLHIPSLAGSKKPNSDDTALDANGGKGFNSQAYYTEVYENEVVFYGVNILEKTIYPKYSYIMESSRKASSELPLITSEYQPTGVNGSITAKLSEASDALSAYYTYASYDQYQSLKKFYYQYKNSTTADTGVIAEFDNRISALKDIAEYTGMPKTYPVKDQYVFENNKSWSKVYAYAWTSGSSSNALWPGVQMKKSGTLNGNDLYTIKFDYAGQYKNIIFTDGSSQTVDIDLSGYKDNGFRLSSKSDGKYTVSNFDVDNGTEQMELALLYSISGSHEWSDIDTFFTLNEDGIYEYLYTAKQDSNFSFSLYDKTNKSYKGLTESDISEFERSRTFEYQLTAQSSRGKSITYKSMKAGDTLKLLYNSKSGVLTVITTPEEKEKLVNNSEISASEITKGDTVTLTSSAQGGTVPYTYAYYSKLSSASEWQLIGSEFFSKANETFTPQTAGVYDIRITIKDSDEQTADKTFSLKVNEPVAALVNKSTVVSEKAQIGDDVRLTGAAEGGTGSYRYAYYFKRSVNSKWSKIGTEFGTSTHATLVPLAAADYDLKVIIKDSKGTRAQKIFKVSVVKSMELTNVSVINRPTTVKKGTTVTLSGRTVGGTKPVVFKFYFKRSVNSKWNSISYGSETGTYAKFTPTTAATYDLKIVATDSKGTKTEKIITIESVEK